MNKKKLLCIASAFFIMFCSSCFGGNDDSTSGDNTDYAKVSENPYEATINSLVATDALGRNFEESDLYSDDKKVGMFYFVWHGEHSDSGIYNVSELDKTDPDSLWSEQPNSVSPLNAAHYWGEPLYGYYASDDPWVLERHLELLTMSGIDYLALDLTNISIYEKNVRALLDKVTELQKQGWNPPKICALLSGAENDQPDDAGRITEFYNKFYKDAKYDSAWYTVDGKPLVGIGMKWAYDGLSDEIKSSLHFRNIVWPFQTPSQYPNDMAWMDWVYPQRVYDMDGFMSVSVAQHNSYAFSKSVNPETADASYNENRGRGWSYTSQKNIAANAVRGTNLQSQWAVAQENRSEIKEVMVTGWNEWIAFKLPGTSYKRYEDNDLGKVCFVDACNMEFSRDLEMMKGGYADNFYLQNMQNTRDFKSNKTKVSYAGAKGSPALDGNFENARTYLDFEGDAMARNFKRADGKETYTNDTNRNDIVKTEVVNDGNYLYIKVTTKDDVVIEKDKTNNMNVLLSVKGVSGANWNGYNFIVNRISADKGFGKTKLEKVSENGKFSFTNGVDCDSYINGKTFAVKIPLSALGVKGTFTVDFKIADGISDQGNIDNYYIDGDCAPIGRLNYRYNSVK